MNPIQELLESYSKASVEERKIIEENLKKSLKKITAIDSKNLNNNKKKEINDIIGKEKVSIDSFLKNRNFQFFKVEDLKNNLNKSKIDNNHIDKDTKGNLEYTKYRKTYFKPKKFNKKNSIVSENKKNETFISLDKKYGKTSLNIDSKVNSNQNSNLINFNLPNISNLNSIQTFELVNTNKKENEEQNTFRRKENRKISVVEELRNKSKKMNMNENKIYQIDMFYSLNKTYNNKIPLLDTIKESKNNFEFLKSDNVKMNLKLKEISPVTEIINKNFYKTKEKNTVNICNIPDENQIKMMENLNLSKNSQMNIFENIKLENTTEDFTNIGVSTSNNLDKNDLFLLKNKKQFNNKVLNKTKTKDVHYEAIDNYYNVYNKSEAHSSESRSENGIKKIDGSTCIYKEGIKREVKKCNLFYNSDDYNDRNKRVKIKNEIFNLKDMFYIDETGNIKKIKIVEKKDNKNLMKTDSSIGFNNNTFLNNKMIFEHVRSISEDRINLRYDSNEKIYNKELNKYISKGIHIKAIIKNNKNQRNFKNDNKTIKEIEENEKHLKTGKDIITQSNENELIENDENEMEINDVNIKDFLRTFTKSSSGIRNMIVKRKDSSIIAENNQLKKIDNEYNNNSNVNNEIKINNKKSYDIRLQYDMYYKENILNDNVKVNNLNQSIDFKRINNLIITRNNALFSLKKNQKEREKEKDYNYLSKIKKDDFSNNFKISKIRKDEIIKPKIIDDDLLKVHNVFLNNINNKPNTIFNNGDNQDSSYNHLRYNKVLFKEDLIMNNETSYGNIKSMNYLKHTNENEAKKIFRTGKNMNVKNQNDSFYEVKNVLFPFSFKNIDNNSNNTNDNVSQEILRNLSSFLLQNSSVKKYIGNNLLLQQNINNINSFENLNKKNFSSDTREMERNDFNIDRLNVKGVSNLNDVKLLLNSISNHNNNSKLRISLNSNTKYFNDNDDYINKLKNNYFVLSPDEELFLSYMDFIFRINDRNKGIYTNLILSLIEKRQYVINNLFNRYLSIDENENENIKNFGAEKGEKRKYKKYIRDGKVFLKVVDSESEISISDVTITNSDKSDTSNSSEDVVTKIDNNRKKSTIKLNESIITDSNTSLITVKTDSKKLLNIKDKDKNKKFSIFDEKLKTKLSKLERKSILKEKKEMKYKSEYYSYLKNNNILKSKSCIGFKCKYELEKNEEGLKRSKSHIYDQINQLEKAKISIRKSINFTAIVIPKDINTFKRMTKLGEIDLINYKKKSIFVKSEEKRIKKLNKLLLKEEKRLQKEERKKIKIEIKKELKKDMIKSKFQKTFFKKGQDNSINAKVQKNNELLKKLVNKSSTKEEDDWIKKYLDNEREKREKRQKEENEKMKIIKFQEEISLEKQKQLKNQKVKSLMEKAKKLEGVKLNYKDFKKKLNEKRSKLGSSGSPQIKKKKFFSNSRNKGSLNTRVKFVNKKMNLKNVKSKAKTITVKKLNIIDGKNNSKNRMIKKEFEEHDMKILKIKNAKKKNAEKFKNKLMGKSKKKVVNPIVSERRISKLSKSSKKSKVSIVPIIEEIKLKQFKRKGLSKFQKGFIELFGINPFRKSFIKDSIEINNRIVQKNYKIALDILKKSNLKKNDNVYQYGYFSDKTENSEISKYKNYEFDKLSFISNKSNRTFLKFENKLQNKYNKNKRKQIIEFNSKEVLKYSKFINFDFKSAARNFSIFSKCELGNTKNSFYTERVREVKFKNDQIKNSNTGNLSKNLFTNPTKTHLGFNRESIFLKKESKESNNSEKSKRTNITKHSNHTNKTNKTNKTSISINSATSLIIDIHNLKENHFFRSLSHDHFSFKLSNPVLSFINTYSFNSYLCDQFNYGIYCKKEYENEVPLLLKIYKDGKKKKKAITRNITFKELEEEHNKENEMKLNTFGEKNENKNDKSLNINTDRSNKLDINININSIDINSQNGNNKNSKRESNTKDIKNNKNLKCNIEGKNSKDLLNSKTLNKSNNKNEDVISEKISSKDHSLEEISEEFDVNKYLEDKRKEIERLKEEKLKEKKNNFKKNKQGIDIKQIEGSLKKDRRQGKIIQLDEIKAIDKNSLSRTYQKSETVISEISSDFNFMKFKNAYYQGYQASRIKGKAIWKKNHNAPNTGPTFSKKMPTENTNNFTKIEHIKLTPIIKTINKEDDELIEDNENKDKIITEYIEEKIEFYVRENCFDPNEFYQEVIESEEEKEKEVDVELKFNVGLDKESLELGLEDFDPIEKQKMINFREKIRLLNNYYLNQLVAEVPE